MSIATDLVDMRLFTNIAETSSLTSGAKLSHISLQAASARIKLLEQRIGVALLFRQTQGVSLTAAGLVYANHARQVLAQLERLGGDLQAFTDGVQGNLRLYVSATALGGCLPELLKPYLLQNPHVTLQITERLTVEIAKAVREGQADLGIVCGSLVDTENLETMPFTDDRWVVAVQCGHPLANVPGGVDFVHTLKYEHLTVNVSVAACQHMNNLASQHNRILRVRIQMPDFGSACRLAAAGVAICVLPESTAIRYREQMAFDIVQLRDEWAYRRMRFCARSFEELPSFGRALVESLSMAGR